MMERSKVVIVDDHPLFRRGLREVIAADGRFQLAGEASTGPGALELIRLQQPCLAVLDINLPGFGGLEVARQAATLRLQTRIVILTMFKDEETFNRALDAGALGFVLKDSAIQEVLSGLVAAEKGEYYLSPAISGYLVRRRHAADQLTSHSPGLQDLTTAERRVLRLVAEKLTSREIAAKLFISPRTVEVHRANISQKLGLKGTHSLLQYALENRRAIQAAVS